MNSNSRLIQIILTGITLLLLGFLGVTTLQNGQTLSQLEQSLLASATDAIPDESPTAEETQAPAPATTPPPPTDIATNAPDPADPSSTLEASETVVVEVTDTPAATVLSVIAGDNNTVLLTSLLKEIQIQLSTSPAVSATNVKARLLILKRKLNDNSSESLAEGIISSEASLSEGIIRSAESTATEERSSTFNGAPTNLTLKFTTLPPSGNYEGWLIITGTGLPPVSKQFTVEVVNFEENGSNPAALAKVSVLLPTENQENNLFATADQPQVNFSLQNLSAVDKLKVKAQLLIVKDKSGSPEKLLSPGYTITSEEVSLPSFGTVNVTLDLAKRLPPSGSYGAWLVVSGEKAQYTATKVTLTIAGSPQQKIQSRLGLVTTPEISLSAVRPHPWSDTVSYDPYSLVLWESNLQPVGNWSILASELADKTNGQSAFLTVEKDANTPNSLLSLSSDPAAHTEVETSIAVKLGLKGIRHPGSYAGSLQIINPGLFSSQSIPVQVTVRDSLWWPTLLIFLISWGLGYLLRYSATTGSENLSALRYRLTVARELLQGKNLQKTNLKLYWQIKISLDYAEVLLSIGDFKNANTSIEKAYKDIEIPHGEIERKTDMHLEVGDPFSQEYYPAGPVVIGYQGEALFFKLAGVEATTQVVWKVNGTDLPNDHGLQSSYLPDKKGTYRLTAEIQNKEKETLSLQLNIRSDRTQEARNRVALVAGIASFAWAAVATVAGLVYIQTNLPTFGSVLDYLLALAWALGLSTASRPTESIAASIFNYLKKTGAQPNKDGDEEPPDNPPQPDTVTVPTELISVERKVAEEILTKIGLKALFTPDGAGENWVVKSTVPNIGSPAPKGGQVTCTLVQPPAGEETTNEKEGSHGDLNETEA